MTTPTLVYVITDGPPGPEHGAAAFVELETADGASVGGVKWAPHPGSPGLWRLGPFVTVPDSAVPAPEAAGE